MDIAISINALSVVISYAWAAGKNEASLIIFPPDYDRQVDTNNATARLPSGRSVSRSLTPNFSCLLFDVDISAFEE
jgi:hypothetical protein